MSFGQSKEEHSRRAGEQGLSRLHIDQPGVGGECDQSGPTWQQVVDTESLQAHAKSFTDVVYPIYKENKDFQLVQVSRAPT
jgi:hypothetical protein